MAIGQTIADPSGQPAHTDVVAKNWFRRLTDSGHTDADDPHQRRQKSVITGASFLKTAACPMWCGFFLIAGAPIAAVIPLFYAVFTWLSIGRMARDKNIAGFRTRQAWLILLLPAGVTVAMGGLVAGGVVALWSFLAPLIALLFHGPRASVRWLLAFFAVVLGGLGIEMFGLLPVVEMHPTLVMIFIAMNVTVVLGISYAAFRYYALLLEEEQAAREALSERVDGLEDEVAAARKAGSYRLVELLGEGGMGEVWRAEHAMLARPAAVKLIRPTALERDTAHTEKTLHRFEREAQATASLTSENTVEVYDFGRTDDGAFYYVMELLAGLNLEDLVRNFGPLPSARVAHLLAQACDSLHEAHQVGLLHRDIKPANIFACRRGSRYDVVKVLDFGLVKPFVEGMYSDGHATAEGAFAATPAYTSPESILAPDDLDGRSDIYLLGCVGYWLASGRPPFDGGHPAKLLFDHTSTTPVPLSERAGRDVDPALERIIHACMAKAPADRPQDAWTLRSALTPIALAGWDDDQARQWWENHYPIGQAALSSTKERRVGDVRFAELSGQGGTPNVGLEQTSDAMAMTTDEAARRAVEETTAAQ